MKILYFFYQYLIGLPLLILSTIITCTFIVLCYPWKNSKAPHAMQVLWGKCVFWSLLIPLKVTGGEKLDPNKSYVFVSNHQSLFDIFAVYIAVPNKFKWLVKKELKKVPFIGWACSAGGHIFVDRTNPRAALQSLERIKSELVDGISTAIFPEGTRTKNGEVGRFKRGAFQIAVDLNLPVVPISVSGLYEAMPSHTYYVKPGSKVSVHVGDPVNLSDFESRDEAIKYLHEQVKQHVKH